MPLAPAALTLSAVLINVSAIVFFTLLARGHQVDAVALVAA